MKIYKRASVPGRARYAEQPVMLQGTKEQYAKLFDEDGHMVFRAYFAEYQERLEIGGMKILGQHAAYYSCKDIEGGGRRVLRDRETGVYIVSAHSPQIYGGNTLYLRGTDTWADRGIVTKPQDSRYHFDIEVVSRLMCSLWKDPVCILEKEGTEDFADEFLLERRKVDDSPVEANCYLMTILAKELKE